MNANPPTAESGVTSSPFACSPQLGAGCSCTVEVTDTNYQESGTYRAVGTTLTETPETPASGVATALGYCVDGSALVIDALNYTNLTAMGSVGLKGVLTLTKE
jgi:hypothetical protein